MAATSLTKIIDADGHIFEDRAGIGKFFPPEWQQVGAFRRIGFIPELDNLHGLLSVSPPGSFTDPGGAPGWARFMDDVGIEAAVLYPTDSLAYGRMVDRDIAIRFCRAYNNWLHEAYLQQDPRFQGMALIPMQEPEEAVKELRRAVEELGMRGAMLPSTGLRTHLGAKQFWPVYAEADRLGCGLAIHGGAHGNLGFDDLNVFAAIHALGHPLGITICFVSMLFNGIFDRFPNARYAFLEGGVGWFLMAWERCGGSYKGFTPLDPRGEYLKLAPGESASQYIERHVKEGRIFVGVEGDEPTLAFAIKAIGNEPFMFSSDFPHEVNNDSCKAEIRELLENEELTDEDKAGVLHRNAERFYNLQPAATAV